MRAWGVATPPPPQPPPPPAVVPLATQPHLTVQYLTTVLRWFILHQTTAVVRSPPAHPGVLAYSAPQLKHRVPKAAGLCSTSRHGAHQLLYQRCSSCSFPLFLRCSERRSDSWLTQRTAALQGSPMVPPPHGMHTLRQALALKLVELSVGRLLCFLALPPCTSRLPVYCSYPSGTCRALAIALKLRLVRGCRLSRVVEYHGGLWRLAR